MIIPKKKSMPSVPLRAFRTLARQYRSFVWNMRSVIKTIKKSTTTNTFWYHFFFSFSNGRCILIQVATEIPFSFSCTPNGEHIKLSWTKLSTDFNPRNQKGFPFHCFFEKPNNEQVGQMQKQKKIDCQILSVSRQLSIRPMFALSSKPSVKTKKKKAFNTRSRPFLSLLHGRELINWRSQQ